MEQSAAYEGQQIYHPKGWWGKYVFSQDHKIIALNTPALLWPSV